MKIYYLKYLKYVLRHKWFVFIECFKFAMINKHKIRLLFLGILHDWSKFRPSEFAPYARFFYGNHPKYSDTLAEHRWRFKLFSEDIDRHFDKAWLYHIHRNKHHWQYWVLREDDGATKTIPMPTLYMLEMVADWRGAGKAITGRDNLKQWYEQNKDNIILSPICRKFVEKKING